MTRIINRWVLPISTSLLLLGACKGSEPGTAGSSTGATQTPAARDSLLTSQNVVLQAQKDSLFGATRSLLAAIASIDSATSQAGIKRPKDKGEPITPYEEQVRARTVEALQRLKTTQARLRSSLAKVTALGGQNSAMKAQLDTFRLTVDALQSQIATQTARGDSLVSALTVATARGDSLQGRANVLTTSLDSAVTASQKVWWIAGTKDYLMKHGIVSEVGGTRFPFIVKVGSTLRAANVHPDTTLFTSFDELQQRVVPLDAAHDYEVVSAQDLTGADRSNAKGRVFRGPIRITDPQKFWKASPYLILLQR